MFARETGAIVAHLRDMFRRAGRGAMVRAARALGLRRTYYSEKRHRQRFDIGALGDHRQALTFAELAAGIFARLGDQAGEGRALVDAARWLHYLGQRRESIAAHQRGWLPRIGEKVWQNLGC
ncbi:MAG: hypothetical protein V3T72_17920 [Thermoanaerobaculia bacterium]